MGEGSFGRVLACLEEASKQMVAVKVVKGSWGVSEGIWREG